MLDITIRGIEQDLAERVKAYAREHKVTLNQAVIKLLRQATGLDEAGLEGREMHQDIAALPGTFSSDESRAFREALNALEGVHPEDLYGRNK